MSLKTGLKLIMGYNPRAFSLKMDALENCNKINGLLNEIEFNTKKLSRGV